MSIPAAIFLDTCIFEGQRYNFNSRQFEQFKEHVNSTQKSLLVPDPTRLELKRHIKEHSSSAASALKGLQKKIKLVSKALDWPLKKSKPDEVEAQIYSTTSSELKEFLTELHAVDLNYAGVDIAQVMEWYDTTAAPFGEGTKRKEFPDAFVVAILDNYCRQNLATVAVISCDSDLKKACSGREHLQFFESLDSFVAASMQFEQARLGLIQSILDSDQLLITSIKSHFMELGFVIEEDWDGEVSNIEIAETTFIERNITAIDSEGFEVSFRVEMSYSADISYEDPNTGTYDSEDDCWWFRDYISKNVFEEVVLTGSAYLNVDSSWAATEEVAECSIDQDTITIVADQLYD
jgi:hypothetical protein